MKISYNWLNQFINLYEYPQEIGAKLTATGLEVEAIEEFSEIKGNLEGFVIGTILTCQAHPNADSLSLTTVDIGEVVLPIVCGAKNVSKGQKVVVATVGTTIHLPSGDSFQIKKAKIRGEVSEGMICAEDELGVGASHEGIMILQTELPNGTPAVNYFNPEIDHVFEIGLTPNRADAASHLGVARDISAVFNRAIHFAFPEPELPKYVANSLKIEIDDYEACPRYSGVVIEGIEVKESSKWLKLKLESIGLDPINNVVDITNFVLHSIGQPLHAFDLSAIKSKKIHVTKLAAGTSFRTLDGKERKLSATDLMICDGTEPMCIAGVFGGENSGVKASTKAIFLESAYFSPDSIRRTAMYHQLKTDASFRFERGTDPNMTVKALKYAIALIIEECGGVVASQIFDHCHQSFENRKVLVKFKNIDRLIGISLTKSKIFEILESLEIECMEVDESCFHVVVPPYRVDVLREADIIEEILRIYGYDNIPLSPQLKSDFISNFPKLDSGAVKNSLASYLVSNGFYEIFTNSLTSPHYTKEYPEKWDKDGNVVILNKLSEDLEIMRRTLLFSGLESIKYNVSHRQNDLKFFEFGKTYQKVKDGYKENEFIAIFMTGDATPEHWFDDQTPTSFYHLSVMVFGMLDTIGVIDYSTEVASKTEFNSVLEIKVSSGTIATIGNVNASVLRSMQIKSEVYYAELDWSIILKSLKTKVTYKEVPKFPEVRRDLSLVLDKNVSFNDIKKLALLTEKKFIKSMNVFSVYEGDKIDAGKKAYAISFILQDERKTLDEKSIDKTMKHLMHAFESQLGAKIRK